MQRGRELGYALSDEQFKQIVENIKKQNNLENDERFQAALKQEGMTMADLRKQLERQMFVLRGAAARHRRQDQRDR
jgi:parvulin-like peptidyl-prolyl isomerase